MLGAFQDWRLRRLLNRLETFVLAEGKQRPHTNEVRGEMDARMGSTSGYEGVTYELENTVVHAYLNQQHTAGRVMINPTYKLSWDKVTHFLVINSPDAPTITYLTAKKTVSGYDERYSGSPQKHQVVQTPKWDLLSRNVSTSELIEKVERALATHA